jgi:uncharacterized protein YbjT (DUF2867 family)
MKIAVTTPTGNIGSRVVERLLESDAEIVLLARRPERLPEAARAGATVHQGTLEDAEFVTTATAGADALFVLVPPNFTTEDWASWQLGIGRNAAEAVRRNGIRRVVLLSSAGAHRPDLGPVTRLGEIEDMLEAAAPDVLSLRAGFFMENLLGAVGTVREHGAVFGNADPSTPIAFVATADLGDAAAKALLDATWSGHRVRAIYGPEDLSYARAAEILAEETGQPVRYVQVDREASRQAFLHMGASEDVADTYADLFVGLARTGFEREPRSEAIEGATSLRSWVREVFVPALGAPVAAA